MSAVLCLSLGPLVGRLLAHAQGRQPSRYEDCPPLSALQAEKRHIPTMGGLLVLPAGILAAVVSGGTAGQGGWLIVVTVVLYALIGLADDVLKFRGHNARGMGAAPKLAATLAIGAAVGAVMAMAGSRAPQLAIPGLSSGISLGLKYIKGIFCLINSSS